MASYSEQEKNELLQIPVEEILRVFGMDTSHSPSDMYFSPFRKEASPSFHISQDGLQWFDFGSGMGGSTLTLVCKILNCDGGKGYDFLAGVSNTFFEEMLVPSGGKAREKSRRIIVHKAGSQWTDRSLIDYAIRRGISEAVLKEWCMEVQFSYLGYEQYVNKAIGFLTCNANWILRSPDTKRCTKSEITGIDIYGNFSLKPTFTVGIIFEGFFDFLSYMEINGGGWPKCDICVLNSVTNIGKAQDWILAHPVISTMFDNDDAGCQAFDLVKKYANGGSVIVNDWSSFYKGFNDLSEMLENGKTNINELTIQSQSLWNKQFLKTFRKD